MQNLSIVKFPNPVLTKKAKKINQPFDSYIKLSDQMIDLMYKAGGIGLAANQVGLLIRLFVTDIPIIKDDMGNVIQEINEQTINQPNNQIINQPKKYFNPEIISKSEIVQSEEGCLSIPDINANVERYDRLEVKYQDENGNYKNEVLTGINAFCFQHELDHLNGKLFWDLLEPIERRIIKKKYKKQQIQEDV